MRIFIAIDINDKLKNRIKKIQKQLSIFSDNMNFVNEDKFHYTLKFLGEIDNKKFESVSFIVKNFVKNQNKFNLNIKGIGVFSNLNHIKVIWLGAKGLYDLQKSLDEKLSVLFEKQKNIIPHLTLARIEYLENKKNLVDFITKNKNIEIGSFEVNEIKLKKSNFQNYQNMEIFKLN